MKYVALLSFLMLGLGLGMCRINSEPIEAKDLPVAQDTWRRTRQGWEQTEQWERPTTPHPSIHPLVIASLEVLLSLTALMAFPTKSARAKKSAA